jgi:hypothetical protein
LPRRVLHRACVVDRPKTWLSRRDILANITKFVGGRTVVFFRWTVAAPRQSVATEAAAESAGRRMIEAAGRERGE